MPQSDRVYLRPPITLNIPAFAAAVSRRPMVY